MLRTVFVFDRRAGGGGGGGGGAGGGGGDMSRYWPPDKVREVYFNEVYEKYRGNATIMDLLNNIPQGAEWLTKRTSFPGNTPDSGQPLSLQLRLRLRFSPA